MKKQFNSFRHKIQALATIITNGNVSGYISGKIYKGDIKNACVPGLNCYSCVGALGSCPIGSLQAVIGKKGGGFPFYVVGFLLLIGSLLGRLVCGWLCPFGLFQDLLHKIPFPKKIRTLPKEKILVKLKYLILLIFVIILPMYLVNNIGNGNPYFCKYICPVGTLEGGIPLVLLNKAMRGSIGFLFVWKNVILLTTIILSIIIYRPFCKLICPLGAIYSLFNKVSFYRYQINCEKCINCGRCAKICLMNVDPVKDANHLECIRCGNCRKACPKGAIELLIAGRKFEKINNIKNTTLENVK
ncbi:4Fe-4S binding protein [Peptoniphilus indolicus]|uniref:Iron-sulfur cluster-binding protein n=2 Tax=Peptoniphilus indolicus TaxID=33030 RepID=G4D503_9FIRM|nr:4Fe-4S binding protein [Peptoniphilus indolicus]EGY79402.1 iron-sulfur cluster-binding protein [Peptoniphilus indolicus ATCC 29427]SUB74568.1 Putative electron transport protein yccM [Peptoniphilus indolicus]